MFELLVNGQKVTASQDGSLMLFLRDELRLTSVKNGCNEGACGTCTIIIDGKATKCCVQKISRMVGKEIITCEGLSPREKEVYGYAFASCGAVQCGFCTPGMVICAKALIDKNPNPTRQEVKEALKNNICRCTGYVKIEDAVLRAAQMIREEEAVPQQDDNAGMVGQSILRVDAEGKALGVAEYVDDMVLPDMLYGGAVRSAYPHAKVLSIDVSEAKAMEGVRAVMTAADLPGLVKVGHLKKDQWVLVPEGEEVHFIGDSIVLIAADSREILARAKEAVKVEYEPLEPIRDLWEAMDPNSPVIGDNGTNLLHEEHLQRGDVEKALAEAAHVVTRKYSTPATEHAFLEPETALALPDGDGVIIYSGDQGIYQTQHECAEACGLPQEKVRVIAKMVGGGFGGKEDMSVQHHAAILALKTGKPVKLSMSRQESINFHPKRHGFEMEITTACDAEGNLTALKAVLYSDTGGFASLGGPVLQRACTHAAGPYNYQNIDILGRAYYTTNPPCGAFRGFGVCQSVFAIECNLNLLAEKVGLSPFEFRYKNAIRPGQVLPNGQVADASTALVETLDAVRPYYEANPKAGIACAMKNSGLGVGLPDTGRCRVVVSGGKAHIYTSAACIGQGVGTVVTQVLSTVTGLPLSKIEYHTPDTATSPDCGNTTASRQTLFAGESCRLASYQLKEAMASATLEELEGREFKGEYIGVTDKMNSGKPNPVSHIAYSYATHLVELDDEGKLKRVVAAHDVGTAVNPVSVEGQIEGGVVIGLGYALTEDFPLVDSVPKVKYGTLGLFKANMVPEIKCIVLGKNNSPLAFGGKGIGEISTIPTAPAAQLAYYNFDGEFRTKLPMEGTPYRKRK